MRITHARDGLATIEFAFVAPFMVLIMLGAADISFFLRAKLRLDTAATSLAQITTQYTQLYPGDFPDLFKIAQLAAGSVVVSGQVGATIISGITNVSGTQTIAWQQISPSSTFVSQFGAVNTTPLLPAKYVLPIGATLVVTEVFTNWAPWNFAAAVIGPAGTIPVNSVALFQPRLAPLDSITPGIRP